jgi:putative addiction module killer protein
MLNTIKWSSDFDVWLKALSDQRARAKILTRLRRAEFGNFGDSEPVGEGVSEMKIDYGPGYRVYYTRTGSTIYLLLIGGDKGSQKRDIKKAKRMAKEEKDD